MRKIKILNVPFDKVGELQAFGEISNHLESGRGKMFIATPNPEMLLSAEKNKQFLSILNNTDINIADGIGILWAADFLEKTAHNKSKIVKIIKGIVALPKIIFRRSSFRALPERVTGTDMMQLICKNIGSKHSVFLLGAGEGVAEKTASILKKKYNTKIVGTHSGSADPSAEDQIVSAINKASPKILFVAFGAPKQELWIARNIDRLDTIKLVMGIGGAFDFISGNIKRAPSFMRKLGLEWLYRLIRQPSRIKRIFNATVVFPFKVIKSSF